MYKHFVFVPNRYVINIFKTITSQYHASTLFYIYQREFCLVCLITVGHMMCLHPFLKVFVLLFKLLFVLNLYLLGNFPATNETVQTYILIIVGTVSGSVILILLFVLGFLIYNRKKLR